MKVLMIEAFYGGSHKQFIDLLYDQLCKCEVSDDSSSLPYDVQLLTEPATKWHWRSRVSGLSMALSVEKKEYDILFTSCVFNLAEFLSVTHAKFKKIILYFHENQLEYPVRNEKERDYQHGYNQIISCLVADVILFNSHYNRQSFLKRISPFLNKAGIKYPEDLIKKVELKSQVLYYPIFTNTRKECVIQNIQKRFDKPLKIVWPHRWEHDKNPEQFFEALFLALTKLDAPKGIKYFEIKSPLDFLRLSVLGESTNDVPKIFLDSYDTLKTLDIIDNWGYLENKEAYYDEISSSDVVISTSNHEFFGVSLTEAVSRGCIPLCPDRLVYPELISKSSSKLFEGGCLYSTTEQLASRIKKWSKRPNRLRENMLTLVSNDFENNNFFNNPKVLFGLSGELEREYANLFSM